MSASDNFQKAVENLLPFPRDLAKLESTYRDKCDIYLPIGEEKKCQVPFRFGSSQYDCFRRCRTEAKYWLSTLARPPKECYYFNEKMEIKKLTLMSYIVLTFKITSSKDNTVEIIQSHISKDDNRASMSDKVRVTSSNPMTINEWIRFMEPLMATAQKLEMHYTFNYRYNNITPPKEIVGIAENFRFLVDPQRATFKGGGDCMTLTYEDTWSI